MSAVRPYQRFAAERPCPICGGWDRMPRGKGVRCFGFVAADRTYGHCTRDDLAGGLPPEAGGTYAHRLEGKCRCGESHGDAPIVPSRADTTRVIRTENFDYENGLRVVRRDLSDGEKQIYQQHRNGAGFIAGRGAAPTTLYRAPELRAADPAAVAFLVEGERCVEALRAHGLLATTTPGGAAQWASTAARAAELLAGRHVVILPDNDAPGRKYAADALATLAPVAGSIRILDLPGLAEHEDVADWLARGGDPEDLVRMEGTAVLGHSPADPLPTSTAPTAPTAPRPRRVVDLVADIVAEAALPVMPTGLEALDAQLGGGLRARMMHVLIAASGRGKTSLAVQIAARRAESVPVLYYSGELTPAQLAARIIAQRTGQSWRSVLSGGIPEDRMREVLAPLELDVLRRCADPIAAIGLAVEEMLGRGRGVPLVVVDYAQLVADIGPDMRLATAAAIRALLALAESREIVLLVLSQGSRVSARAMGAGGGRAESYMDAGAETAEIERAAGTVIALVYAAEDGATVHEVTAMIAKARLGVPGQVGLRFHGASGRWENLGAVPLSAAAREDAKIDLRVLEAVRASGRAPTRTELAKGGVPGCRGTSVSSAIERLLVAGELIIRSEPRPNARQQMRPTDVLAFPSPDSSEKPGASQDYQDCQDRAGWVSDTLPAIGGSASVTARSCPHDPDGSASPTAALYDGTPAAAELPGGRL